MVELILSDLNHFFYFFFSLTSIVTLQAPLLNAELSLYGARGLWYTICVKSIFPYEVFERGAGETFLKVFPAQ